ncbi:CoA-disulfide reductase [uncultured Tyzzerella sp.]|uniref:CoA-disulfide reductase n=1 Tax=uncultured Tyzzerella sp. TaxID=2321398 RepID=UPI002943296B|nr:CoA-disulfide reductase [uncultured Tyzzerella sp.]
MRVIIIGGIAAGMSAAAKFRRLDKDAHIKVYEKTSIVSFGACGLPYFVGGFFDNEKQMIARSPEKFKETGIDISVEHEVLSVDVDNKKITVKNLKTNETFEDNYDKLMIATGASAIIPPIKNFNIENVHTLKSLEDGRILKEKMKDESIKKVAIIGAGFIGLEAVEAAREYKKEVSVFQLEDRILKEVFDKEVTDLLEQELKNKGVNLFLNSKVVELKGDIKVTKVVTENEEIDTDLVILATGVKPNTAFLQDTGIEMLKNGAIVVDKEGKTSIEHIYSAGDCATVTHLLKPEQAYIPLATVANKFGRIVGENISGKGIEYEGSLGSACIKVLEMEAGRTGLTESEANSLGINYKTVFITDKNQTDYYPGQESISIKLIYNGDTKVILGAQVVGKKDAVQRTNALAVAIYAKLTTEQLGMMDFCYSPPFARTWDILNRVGNVAK